MIIVRKKTGIKEDWSFGKIQTAVTKSADRVCVAMTDADFATLEDAIVSQLSRYKAEGDIVEVEYVHSLVETSLDKLFPVVADSYRNYRNHIKRTYAILEKIFQQTKNMLYTGDKENANFDMALVSTKGSVARRYLMKELFKEHFLSEEELVAIEEGYIYIHDLSDLGFNAFNCCLFDADAVLKGGLEMSGLEYTSPKTVLSACQVLGDIVLNATAQQFGGFTVPDFDKTLVPYVEKSLAFHLLEGMKYGATDPNQYAADQTLRELRQGIQAFEMKTNSVPSSRGDTAFVTITFGCVDGSVNPEMQRAVCHAILETRMNGQGDGLPVKFPKLVYLHSEEQHKEPEQQELFDKAILCNSKSMYPDYLSLDEGYVGKVFKETGLVIHPMGCRAFLSRFEGADGKEFYTGRANIGAVSLNLPMIWQKSGGTCFWNDLEHYMQMTRRFLQKRYEAVANNPASTNPLCFTQGGMAGGRLNPTDKIGMGIVKGFTASFGITALNEFNTLVEGKPLHESNRRFVNQVIDFIDSRVESFKAIDGYLYALYGTPAESLAGTQLKQFRDKFGIIKGVSDGEFFSNSFHAHVSADITPFEKQDIEYELFHKINGGHIQYVRIEDRHNLEAIKAIVKRGMKMGFYQGINFDLVTCKDCGAQPSTIVDTCPVCGGHHIKTILRVCGYLGEYERFNDSKVAEVKERISM